MNWLLLVLFVAALVGGWNWFFHDREIHHPSGAALALSPPAIVLGSDSPAWVDDHGFQYRALGRMSGRVVVVSRTNYAIGEFAHLAPTDLAIVWGQLSDPGTYTQVHFDQRGSPLSARYVAPELKRGTRLAALPFPEVEAFLRMNLAHLHAIPADKQIAAQLEHIRPGQVVTFSGLLVEAKSPAGGMYVSAVKLGNYHCEIAWVDELTLE